MVIGVPQARDGAGARPNPVCKECRTICLESVAACAAADPRLARCSERRLAFCLRRATKACTRNLKKCCRRNCRKTGLLVCCGSATSARPTTTTTLDGGSATTTTVTGGSTTTTTIGSDIPCATDGDCATCGCCNQNVQVCSGATGSSTAVCCNIAGSAPTALQPGICGPNTPAVCPSMAVCPPPGTNVGGIQYTCQWCAASGAIIEQFHASNELPQSYPSNVCMRH
jgi:hypothetical protein